MKNYIVKNIKIKNKTNSTPLSAEEVTQATMGAILYPSDSTRKVLIAIEGDDLVRFDSEKESNEVTEYIRQHPHANFYWTTQEVVSQFTEPAATPKPAHTVITVADSKTDATTALLPRTNENSSWSMRKTLSWIGTFIEAELGSFSWPSFIAWIIQHIDRNKNLTREQNALTTAIIWQIMALVELGLQYYLNVTRADGEKDPQISDVKGEENAPFATSAIIISFISQVLGGITAMLAINLDAADAELFGYLTLGLLVGGVQGIAFLMSDAQTLWLSYMASKPAHERVKHLTQQPGLKLFFENARGIATIGREIYAPAMAGLGSYFFYCLGQIFATELDLTEQNKTTLTKLSYGLLPFIYEGSAEIHRKFDVANMIKGLEAINILIDKTPYLMRDERNKFIRWIGYILYGQAMTNAIVKLCDLICNNKDTGPKIASNISLFFHALTTFAQTYREFLAYVANSDRDAVEQNKGGLLLSLYVQNPEREFDIAHVLVHVLKVLAAKVTYTHWSTRATTILREIRTQAGLGATPASTPAHGAATASTSTLSPQTLLPPAQRPRGDDKSAVPAFYGTLIGAQSTARAVPGKAVPKPKRGVAGRASNAGSLIALSGSYSSQTSPRSVNG